MSKIEQSWFKPFGLINLILLPFSALFWFISNLRKQLYKFNVLRAFTANTPIIVIGNISVGGNGKTPFVLWLYSHLTAKGLKVGIISRGYGAQAPSYPYLVTEKSTTVEAGDEPVLMFQRLQCPIAVGPNRQHSIELLEQKFELDVIISDDGMQHYKMPRTIECCIVDSQRQFGNGLLMPAGPLRETKQRLKEVDLVVENGGNSEHSYQLEPSAFISVYNGQKLENKCIKAHVVSAIGNPKRFEHSIQQQGITLLSTHHFRDHYAYKADDFSKFGDDYVLMTEKDAVKCRGFAKANWYYLPVNAKPTQSVVNELNILLKQKGILNGL
ncbi:tetraacyldisaccharide 4'-kinase [Pseudoalteromonas sp. MMG010]|uniref:tetraacyldisaccharide 4'-kinase n=1 Tax=Pseudoalteromonas sp. MMG010 TaxID=2822685 RepID=UPI001B3A7324|nr:tetraacyldisaccharide 4'-kinase [Pseudoalteromonas sp. MMG010]MBQ4832337.1 tetraacyldisaccharide 4'-kinase [Pseudoalteromonas sp. MMG010]